MLRRHRPILLTVGAASASFLALGALRYDELAGSLGATSGLWFLAGALYANLFEHWVHRFPMHQGFPMLRNVRWHHIEHHRIFHGSNFRTARPGDLAHIPGRPWIFPILLGAHYALLTAILPLGAAMAFLLASLLHYLGFEISHWLTHLDGNAVDRALARVPLLAGIRAHQIEHHRLHHETPNEAFNFNPPYLGDVLLGRKRASRPGRAPAPVPAPLLGPVLAPAIAPVLATRRAMARPVVLFGTAIVLGAVALGIAAFQHSRTMAGASSPRTRS